MGLRQRVQGCRTPYPKVRHLTHPAQLDRTVTPQGGTPCACPLGGPTTQGDGAIWMKNWDPVVPAAAPCLGGQSHQAAGGVRNGHVFRMAAACA